MAAKPTSSSSLVLEVRTQRRGKPGESEMGTELGGSKRDERGPWTWISLACPRSPGGRSPLWRPLLTDTSLRWDSKCWTAALRPDFSAVRPAPLGSAQPAQPYAAHPLPYPLLQSTEMGIPSMESMDSWHTPSPLAQAFREMLTLTMKSCGLWAKALVRSRAAPAPTPFSSHAHRRSS